MQQVRCAVDYLLTDDYEELLVGILADYDLHIASVTLLILVKSGHYFVFTSAI